MGLLPPNREHGWAPYGWLAFLSFFLLQPIFDHAGWREWSATVLGTAIFLFLYFSLFRCSDRWKPFDLAGIVLLGVLFAPLNGGALIFFIYSAVFIGFVFSTPRLAFVMLGALLAIFGFESWLLHMPSNFWITGFVVSIGVGVSNVYMAEKNRANRKLRMAQEEVEHLAKVAERERIARDLHDVLGHTLSVIILKSELAGKLIDRDPERAKLEIADVERTSRAALAEVRSTIRGYRTYSLDAEFKHARAALETAGVKVKSESVEVRLTPAQESVVALVLREAVTNVVRHARARNCYLRLAPIDGSCVLEVQDDGLGGFQAEGNGLRGMRERIEALGGVLERETMAGTRLRIKFPLLTKESGNGKS
jgi:two-component system, NarL family, sensor histidine kinase DesK